MSEDRLSDLAYRKIRSELLCRGSQSFGGHLTEQHIAHQLSLSRTPVREAIQRLHLQGWLEELPGKGLVPRHSRVRDVTDVFELRLMLEPLAAMLAAQQGATTRVSSLQLDGYGPELSFHMLVARGCGVGVLETAIYEISQFSVVSAAEGVQADFGPDHSLIASAINEGDCGRAWGSMAEHLARVRQRRLETLQGPLAPRRWPN